MSVDSERFKLSPTGQTEAELAGDLGVVVDGLITPDQAMAKLPDIDTSEVDRVSGRCVARRIE